MAETIGDRVRHGRLVLEGLGMSDDELKQLKRIVLVACGTACRACVVGQYVDGGWSRVPVEFGVAAVDLPESGRGEQTLVIGISQSGETRDTIAALELARELGARTVAITNMMGSQITREVDSVLYTRAGIEMSVAATKTSPRRYARLPHRAEARPDSRDAGAGRDRVHPRLVYESREDPGFLDGDHPMGRWRPLPRRALLPLPRTPHRAARRARGRPGAEGDLVHPDPDLLEQKR